jgi:hypothetical protein
VVEAITEDLTPDADRHTFYRRQVGWVRRASAHYTRQGPDSPAARSWRARFLYKSNAGRLRMTRTMAPIPLIPG